MRSGLRIVVLRGGVSKEREISLESGAAVLEALRGLGLDATDVVVDDRRLSVLKGCRYDVAFIALHGAFGEDGGVQAILEAQDIAYTGSGVAASMRAMNKVLSKRIFEAHGISTPAYEVMNGSIGSPSVRELRKKLSFPVVVKPAAEGSSLGVSVASEEEEIVAALDAVHEFGPVAIVESLVRGREVTVGILGDEALPIIELRPKRRFFDFVAKYEDGVTEYIVNPDMSPEEEEKVKEGALRAFRTLGCSGFGRADMVFSESGEAYVLEVNTIPGFTSHSLVPMAAKAAGISFPELCYRIIELALEENGRK